MLPIIFDESATSFNTNGYGRLSDALSCVVKEELNGIYELEMEYPITGSKINYIKNSAIICAIPYDGGNMQAFRIYEVTKPLNGRIMVYAEHISYQMNWIPLIPFSASSLSDCLTKLKTYSAESNPFTFWTDKTVTSGIGFLEPKTLRAFLGGEEGSILQHYKGEYEFDNYTVRLWKKRGEDNGVTLRYGKNIIDINQEANIQNTYTGLMPYWISDMDLLMTLPEVVVRTSKSANFPYNRTLIKDFTDDFETQPSETQLRERTNEYITANNIGDPSVSINVDFVALWQTEEYKNIAPLERVKLGDTVTVIFEKLGIKEQARVVEYEYNVLKDRYNSIQIGDYKSNLERTLVEQSNTIELNRVTAREDAKNATDWLTRGDGYLVIARGEDGSWREMFCMDTPSELTAKQVLRINQNGIGFSRNGINGPFYQAWTLDGKLLVGGTSTATIAVENQNNIELFKIDNTGLSVKNDVGTYKFNVNNDGISWTSSNSILDKNGTMYFLEKGAGKTTGNVLKVNSDGISFLSNGYEGSTVNQKWSIDGSMQIGTNFKVSKDGSIDATNGKFSGSIKTGKTPNQFVVDENGNMKLGSTFSVSNEGALNVNNLFKLSKEGRLEVGSTTYTKLILENDGTFKIGNKFTISNEGAMTVGTGSYKFTLSSDGDLKLGNNTFSIDHEGNLNVNNKFKLDKDGNLNVTTNFSLTNEGELTMKKGSISLGSRGFSVDDKGNLKVGYNAFSVDNEGNVKVGNNFSITKSGEVTSKDITISGGSLNIGDNFIVERSGATTAKSLKITGGSILVGEKPVNPDEGDEKITGEYFEVTNSGKLTAANATFYGKITSGSTITGASIKASTITITNDGQEEDPTSKNVTFKIGTDGKVMIREGDVVISSGSIKIGSKFTVDNDGNMKAVDGDFKGTITSSEINIPNSSNPKFIVTKQGKVTAKSIEITGGAITGSTITLGNDNSTYFSVDKNGKMSAGKATFTNGEISITGSPEQVYMNYEEQVDDHDMPLDSALFYTGTIKINNGVINGKCNSDYEDIQAGTSTVKNVDVGTISFSDAFKDKDKMDEDKKKGDESDPSSWFEPAMSFRAGCMMFAAKDAWVANSKSATEFDKLYTGSLSIIDDVYKVPSSKEIECNTVELKVVNGMITIQNLK